MSTSVRDRNLIRQKILVVDDDSYVSSSLAAMLESLDYCVLACAGSGADAVDMTRRLRPDLVLMDIKMGDMDGLEASKRILEQRPLPIIIVTAMSDPEVIQRADQIGVAGYLVKPFMMKELTAAITMAFSRFRQLRSMNHEPSSLKESVRSRMLIEKAKGLLMERENLTERQAYSRIQHLSRNRNISIVKLAEVIIRTTAFEQGKHRDSSDQRDSADDC